MNHASLERSMADAVRKLRAAGHALGVAGQSLAETEREYRRLLAVKLVDLVDAGRPAGLSADLARGDPVVSEAKYKRDLAEAEVDRAKAEIRLHEARIDICRTLDAFERHERFASPGTGEGGFGE